MRAIYSIALFGIAGVIGCLAVVFLTNTLAISPRFPVFAGEDDFSLRILYFMLIAIPGFLLVGGWIGFVFSSSKRKAGLMLAGAVLGTCGAFVLFRLVPSISSNLSTRDSANRAVMTFLLVWVGSSFLGSWIFRLIDTVPKEHQ